MGTDTVFQGLFNAGVGGLIIIALVKFWGMKEVSDKLLLDRLDKIVDRHLDAEKGAQAQIREQYGMIRELFDRVINICNDLSLAVRDLRDATKSNEMTSRGLSASIDGNSKAIEELRRDMKSLRDTHGNQQSLPGPESPRPFDGR